MTTPISATLVDVRRALADHADAALWSLSHDELSADLAEVAALRAQVAELELRLVAQADPVDLAASTGAADTASMWAVATRQDQPVAKHRVRLATALDTDRALTREAIGRGEVSEAQASVIVRALDELPTDLDPETFVHAEKELLAHAATFDPKTLRMLGKKILEVVAPDIADAQERRALEREEAHAEQHLRLTMSDYGHGLVHGRFTLPAATAAMLRKLILALCKPEVSTGSTTQRPRQMGAAFRELIERYPAEAIPDAGGVAASIVVTVDLDTLRTDGVATLDTGHKITAGQARRLACEAGIIPMVLGRDSQPLDVGRQARLHTKPQRLAIGIRDKTCTADRCDHPPGLCHVHHDQPWAHGGTTSVENGRLLCPKHHRMIHSGHYRIAPGKHGRLLFLRV